MLVQKLLTETLEKLLQDDFETLKFYLSGNILDGCDPIPAARLENATRVQTVRKMIESYGEDLAVKVTIKILKEMNCNGPKQELLSRYTAGKPATPASSSSSSSSSAAAPGMMLAQDRSVIIAPNGTMGALNININK